MGKEIPSEMQMITSTLPSGHTRHVKPDQGCQPDGSDHPDRVFKSIRIDNPGCSPRRLCTGRHCAVIVALQSNSRSQHQIQLLRKSCHLFDT